MINEKVHLVEGVSCIKQLREKLGLTQLELAYHLGVSITTVSRWEVGRSQLTLTTSQWKKFHAVVLKPLNIEVEELPEDLGAPYVKAA